MRRLTFAFVAPLALAACIEESPLAHQGMPRGTLTSTSQTNPLPSAPASTAAPAPTPSGNASETARPAGAVFDGALQVVGYRVDPPQASPGQTVTVSVFLRAVQPLTVDDMMFVHVDDAEGKPVRANADHWPAGHKLPMTQWKVGELVRDQFQVQLNGFEQSNAATIWLGFYDPQRDTRMALSNAQQVKNDGNNRYALGDIPLTH